MPESENMPTSGEGTEESSTEPEAQANVEQPAPEPAPKQVDLAAEAGDVAAKQPRSLDELGLDADTRTRLESYISRQINDAKTKWDERKEKEITEGQYLTREEVTGLLTQQAEETRAREDAKDSFLRNLGQHGIQVGSEEYDKVAQYYAQAVERGTVTPAILSDKEGLEMLLVLSGAMPKDEGPEPTPSQGLPKAHPEGLQHADGSLQLGAALLEGQEMPMQQRMEKAMIEALKKT